MGMNIGLVYGGISAESEVSEKSALNLLPYLQKAGFNVTLIQIGKDENGKPIIPFTELKKVDCAFLVTHGTFGEDGTLQGLLESIGVPYTGSSVLASALGMSKMKSRFICSPFTLPVPSLCFESMPNIEEVKKSLGTKLFIKPEASGSSVGTTILDNPNEQEAKKAFEEAKRFSKKVLFETYISPLKELECLVWEKNGELMTAGPIMLGYNGPYLDYDSKYSLTSTAKPVFPALVSEETKALVRKLAKEVFSALGAEGFARVDFFFDCKKEILYFNEINTLPGMTKTSHVPFILQSEALSMEVFLKEEIMRAIKNA